MMESNPEGLYFPDIIIKTEDCDTESNWGAHSPELVDLSGLNTWNHMDTEIEAEDSGQGSLQDPLEVLNSGVKIQNLAVTLTRIKMEPQDHTYVRTRTPPPETPAQSRTAQEREDEKAKKVPLKLGQNIGSAPQPVHKHNTRKTTQYMYRPRGRQTHKRRFTTEEVEIILKQVESNVNLLKNPAVDLVNRENKDRFWQKITAAVNTVSPVKRERRDVYMKWYSMKQVLKRGGHIFKSLGEEPASQPSAKCVALEKRLCNHFFGHAAKHKKRGYVKKLPQAEKSTEEATKLASKKPTSEELSAKQVNSSSSEHSTPVTGVTRQSNSRFRKPSVAGLTLETPTNRYNKHIVKQFQTKLSTRYKGRSKPVVKEFLASNTRKARSQRLRLVSNEQQEAADVGRLAVEQRKQPAVEFVDTQNHQRRLQLEPRDVHSPEQPKEPQELQNSDEVVELLKQQKESIEKQNSTLLAMTESQKRAATGQSQQITLILSTLNNAQFAVIEQLRDATEKQGNTQDMILDLQREATKTHSQQSSAMLSNLSKTLSTLLEQQEQAASRQSQKLSALLEQQKQAASSQSQQISLLMQSLQNTQFNMLEHFRDAATTQSQQMSLLIAAQNRMADAIAALAKNHRN